MDGLRNIGANMSGLLRGELPFLYGFVQIDLSNIFSIQLSLIQVLFIKPSSTKLLFTKLAGEH
jgi:hypothetical protein